MANSTLRRSRCSPIYGTLSGPRFTWTLILSPPERRLMPHIMGHHSSLDRPDYSLATTTSSTPLARHKSRCPLSSLGSPSCLVHRLTDSAVIFHSSKLNATRVGTAYITGYRIFFCLHEQRCFATTAAASVLTRPHHPRDRPTAHSLVPLN